MPKSDLRVSHVRQGEQVVIAENRLPTRVLKTTQLESRVVSTNVG